MFINTPKNIPYELIRTTSSTYYRYVVLRDRDTGVTLARGMKVEGKRHLLGSLSIPVGSLSMSMRGLCFPVHGLDEEARSLLLARWFDFCLTFLATSGRFWRYGNHLASGASHPFRATSHRTKQFELEYVPTSILVVFRKKGFCLNKYNMRLLSFGRKC